jgi:hypothetical protein
LELRVDGAYWPEREKELPLLRSACLLKASKSGFASRGTCFGMAAAKDLIEDGEGLQLSLAMPEESRGSLPESTTSPK